MVKRQSWRARAEAITDITFSLTTLYLVAVAMVPPIIIAIIGIVSGTFPTQQQGGLLGVASGYPAFNPQSWLLYPPAVVFLALSIYTIPLPLKDFLATSRGFLTAFTLIFGVAVLETGTAYAGAPGIHNEGRYAGLFFVVAFVLLWLRTILGWLHLVPASWRIPEKKTEGFWRGTVEVIICRLKARKKARTARARPSTDAAPAERRSTTHG